MEIIHLVLGKANPNRMNGVNKVVSQLADKQWDHGMNVSIWGITRDHCKNYGERHFKTRLFKKSLNPFSFDPELGKAILEKKGKAVIHLHGGWVPVFSQLAELMGRHGVHYVFTPHGAYNSVAMQRSCLRKKIYFQLFEKSVLKHADKIHCIGQSEVSGLDSIFKTDKVVLLPYGYQAKQQPLLQGAVGKEMIIGFVGRLDKYTKGLDLLVEAFARLQKDIPASRLWIVGDGPDRRKLEQLIATKDLQATITLFGSKFGPEKDALIQQMQVFAHPSRNEGLPSAVLEAANFGVPCIVSQATNVAHYVEAYKSGITIGNENVTELVEALLKMYAMHQAGEMLSMRRNAQSMVIEAFGWDRLVYEFSELYAA
jgi:glycosyltransferase involved in cell wall biosynthesis